MIHDSLTPPPLISNGTQERNHVISFSDETNAKCYKDRSQHTSNRLLINNKTKQAFPWRCWKCKTVLSLRLMKNKKNGLYCKKCSRFRKFRVEMRGGGPWSRTDVRRSGALKRKVLLGEVTESNEK